MPKDRSRVGRYRAVVIGRRAFMGGGSSALVCGWTMLATPAIAAEIVRPEDFGAKGDGITNDSDAFARLSAHVNERGGATVALRKTTYIVGRQIPVAKPADLWAFSPQIIMDFRNLTRPLVIRGNGARLQCAAGLRYGTFDPASGEKIERPMPNLKQGELATPYRAMIYVGGSQGTIEIRDLELDGNLPELRIGGPYGDTGYQIPAIGLFLENNRSTETIINLHTHHHAQDGIEINGDDRRKSRSRFENVVSEYNGRQGVSVIGGRGYDFVRCKFNHTGRSTIGSAPGSGFDIEAEGEKINRDFNFTDCEFVNNIGCGMVADSGDSEGANFIRCTFVGTSAWSAWPNKPRFRFRDCRFVGTMVNAFGDVDTNRAARFDNCFFTDDPKLSPDGKVYLGGGADTPIVNLGEIRNIMFHRCSFIVSHAALPWTVHVIYSDCEMRQQSRTPSYPRGTYIGRTTISGPADLYRSKVVGEVVLNGRLIANAQL